MIFYVPFAAAVLLVSLGSDYNIFSVGYIWEEARRRPLPEALAVAVPRSTRAINAAGITLAVSFGLIALIPIAPFQELAFAVAVGVLMLGVVLARTFWRTPTARRHEWLTNASMYWHFVDLVWILVFTFIYLL